MHRFHWLPTHWLLLITLTSLLTACQTQPTQLPEWISNPNTQNNTLSAVGEGISLKEAQANAKEALAAQLLSHVSNELTVFSVSDGAFQRTYTERLSNAKFNDIPLPATRFTQTARIDHRFFTQISLDKLALKDFLSTRLSQQIKHQQRTLNDINKKPNAFEQWWKFEQQKASITQLTDQTLIYNSLFSPKNKKASQLINAFGNAYNQAKSSMILSIKDATDIPQLSNTLEAQLSHHGIQVKSSNWLQKRPSIHAKLDVTSQKLQGDYYALSTLNIALTSQNNQTLARFRLTAKGISIRSAHDAKQKSHRKLLDQLKHSDIIQRFKDA